MASLPIGTTGSHVPHESLDQTHAASMPDITRAVSRAPLGLIPGQTPCPVSMSPRLLSTRHQRFTCVRLPDPYLTRCSRAFSSPLTTLALYQRSVRWFETWSCTPVPRGPPSSLVQHCVPFRLPAFGCAFVAHGVLSAFAQEAVCDRYLLRALKRARRSASRGPMTAVPVLSGRRGRPAPAPSSCPLTPHAVGACIADRTPAPRSLHALAPSGNTVPRPGIIVGSL